MNDLAYGVIDKRPDGVVSIPVTSIAKTIADCFKFRSKVGLAVALEALRDAWQQKLVTMDDLWYDVPLRPTRDSDMLGFGMANSRMKDYFDLWVLLRNADLDQTILE